MPSTVLYRKWRPQTLGQVVGQEHVTRTLLNALTQSKLAHAYLFTGPRGTGKTSTARILAKAINCQTNGKGEPCGECGMCTGIAEGRAMDIIEIDAASNRSIDDIRDLRDRIGFAPAEARFKVYIIDEVHMLTDAAFNALLKTLEEPPPHAIFVLATTEIHKVPATILSRCQRFDFRRIPQHELAAHLGHICDAEGLEYEPAALDLIARTAAGGARDAVSLLEQVEVAYGGRVMLADTQAQLGITGDLRAVEIIRALAQNDLTTGMQLIQDVREDGVNLPQFGKEVVSHLRNLMLIKADAAEAVELPQEIASELRQLARNVPLETITRSLRIFGGLDFRGDTASSLPLELALVDCVLAPAQGAAAPAPAAEAVARPAAAPARPAPQPAAPPPAAAAPQPRPATTPTPPPAPAAPDPILSDPPPVQRPAALAGGGGSYNLEQMREIVQQVKLPRVKFIESLLKSAYCSVVAVDPTTVTFGFKANFKAHKDRLEQDANVRQVEQALKEVTGIDYRVRVVLTDANGNIPGEGGNSMPAAESTPPAPVSRGHLVRAALDKGARHIPQD